MLIKVPLSDIGSASSFGGLGSPQPWPLCTRCCAAPRLQSKQQRQLAGDLLITANYDETPPSAKWSGREERATGHGRGQGHGSSSASSSGWLAGSAEPLCSLKSVDTGELRGSSANGAAVTKAPRTGKCQHRAKSSPLKSFVLMSNLFQEFTAYIYLVSIYIILEYNSIVGICIILECSSR